MQITRFNDPKSTASLSIERRVFCERIHKKMKPECKTAFVPYIIIITILNFKGVINRLTIKKKINNHSSK
ncbi:hypothetical protein EGF32_14175 [Salmonella enterica]|uniref:Uncharacterized protein n=3 Tax=Salmonella enterica TaxID=28901 RepID=A0A2T8X7J6_SALET|nr:hypothetical protein CS348_08710 [Salmonella enterica subsp. enterica serovar Gaminara]EAA8043449.1 hypothetical protein [Salmonella enterica]ECF6719810.1 hypothetical protein [Salmonella enterica subsp. enterica]PAP49005.1 hypothetical protein CJS40_14680 [Salmonella enterica subsp. enterica serovar Aberdeen]EAA8932361.1 hypothetical protein [Salmonella enterica subsp. enterica serovar Gaminara]